MCYHYDKDHVARLKSQVIQFDLTAPAGFFSASIEDLQKCYNGIGPDAWNPKFRKLVTELLTYFEPEALIHDWEYAHMPRTYWHFTLANIRMATNAFYFAHAQKKGWKHTLRQTKRGLTLTTLCQLGGWKGYKNTKVVAA